MLRKVSKFEDEGRRNLFCKVSGVVGARVLVMMELAAERYIHGQSPQRRWDQCATVSFALIPRGIQREESRTLGWNKEVVPLYDPIHMQGPHQGDGERKPFAEVPNPLIVELNVHGHLNSPPLGDSSRYGHS